MTNTALSVQNITKAFGGLKAVDNCSFDVAKGVIAGLIGPNGAGKTTLFELISGLLKVDSGKIKIGTEEITHMPVHKRVELGLGRTFQISRSLRKLKVLDNLKLSAQSQLGEHVWNVWLRPKAVREQERMFEEKALKVLEFLNLTHLKEEYAGNLSGGQKKLLEIGRMLMLEPKLILMDEPLAGVNPTLGNEINDHLIHLKEEGLTVLVVEHNVKNIMSICDVIYVMNNGLLIAQGPPDMIRKDEKVIEAYLGVG